MERTYYSYSSGSTYSMSKVFGWMFYAILITALTSLGVPYLLVYFGVPELYNPLLFIGLISVFILCFVAQRIIMTSRIKATPIVVFTLFAVSMGLWISPLVISYDLTSIVYTLFITSAIFGIMAIYGAVTKRDLTGFGSFLFMLLLGSIILTLFNTLFAGSMGLNWFLSYLTLGIYIGFIAYDVQKVKRIAESGQLSNNISLLMALNLYIDFVYVFIRLLSLIRRKN